MAGFQIKYWIDANVSRGVLTTIAQESVVNALGVHAK
jgi:hypothetical protein